MKADKAVQEPEKKENVSGEKIKEEKKKETKSSSLKSQKSEGGFWTDEISKKLIKKRTGKKNRLFPSSQKILKR